MKKNGKKYRKLQKERELRKSEYIEVEEVDGIKTSNLVFSQIITKNPVLSDNLKVREEYYERLRKYVKLGGGGRRKYESSELCAYKTILFEADEINEIHPIEFYKHYILFDFIHVLGYTTEKIKKEKIQAVKEQYMLDFPDSNEKVFNKIINSVQGDENKIISLNKNGYFDNESEYIELIKKNISFRNRKPISLMVTATMSAGKSTFINSLIGKYVCLSQNMACTSKIHSIINKAFEDGLATELDHDLVMTAGDNELLNDNEGNSSDMIYVSTSFHGELEGERIIINDSPGVNFSGEQEHKNITDKLLKRKKYNVLIYLMNFTQLGTNDEAEHLDYVKKIIGRTPIIFVMNKVDSIDSDDENIEDIIKRQILYLEGKGFKNPIVCPVSARAGFLAKKQKYEKLQQYEELEYFNYVMKFKQMNLLEHYRNILPSIKCESEKNEDQLIASSGIAYVEEIIKVYAKGGKVNGSN